MELTSNRRISRRCANQVVAVIGAGAAAETFSVAVTARFDLSAQLVLQAGQHVRLPALAGAASVAISWKENVSIFWGLPSSRTDEVLLLEAADDVAGRVAHDDVDRNDIDVGDQAEGLLFGPLLLLLLCRGAALTRHECESQARREQDRSECVCEENGVCSYASR